MNQTQPKARRSSDRLYLTYVYPTISKTGAIAAAVDSALASRMASKIYDFAGPGDCADDSYLAILEEVQRVVEQSNKSE